jgi:hypothetical protein
MQICNNSWNYNNEIGMEMVMKMELLMMKGMVPCLPMIYVASRMVTSASSPPFPSGGEVFAISGGYECRISDPSLRGESILQRGVGATRYGHAIRAGPACTGIS